MKYLIRATLSAIIGFGLLVSIGLTSTALSRTICNGCTHGTTYLLIACMWMLASIVGGACAGLVAPAKSMIGAWVSVGMLLLMTTVAMLMQSAEGHGIRGISKAVAEGVSVMVVFALTYAFVQHYRGGSPPFRGGRAADGPT